MAVIDPDAADTTVEDSAPKESGGSRAPGGVLHIKGPASPEDVRRLEKKVREWEKGLGGRRPSPKDHVKLKGILDAWEKERDRKNKEKEEETEGKGIHSREDARSLDDLAKKLHKDQELDSVKLIPGPKAPPEPVLPPESPLEPEPIRHKPAGSDRRRRMPAAQEAARVTKAPLKEDNDDLQARLATDFSEEEGSMGTQYTRDYTLGLKTPSAYAALHRRPREVAWENNKEIYYEQLDKALKFGKYFVKEAMEVPEELYRGAVLRNIKNAEDAVNFVSEFAFDSDWRTDFAPAGHEGDPSIVADIAEYIPMVYFSGVGLAGSLARGAAKLGAGAHLAKGLQWVRFSSVFTALESLHRASRTDAEGSPVPPEHEWGEAVGPLAEHMTILDPEDPKAKAQRQALYREGGAMHRLKAHLPGVIVDELFGELAVRGFLSAVKPTAKGLIKTTRPKPTAFDAYMEVRGIEEKAVKTLDELNLKHEFTDARVTVHDAKIRQAQEDYYRYRRDFQLAGELEDPTAKEILRAKEQAVQELRAQKGWLIEHQKQMDVKYLEKNLEIVRLAQEHHALQSPHYRKVVVGDELHVIAKKRKRLGEGVREIRKEQAEQVAKEGPAPSKARPGEKTPSVLEDSKPKPRRDILSGEDLAGVDRRKAFSVLNKAFKTEKNIAKIDKNTEVIRAVTEKISPEMTKVQKDPEFFGNIVELVGSARHELEENLLKTIFPRDVTKRTTGPGAYKVYKQEGMFDLIDTYMKGDVIPEHLMKGDLPEKVLALLRKRQALQELHEKLGSEVGAGLQAMDTVAVKDRFFMMDRPLSDTVRWMGELSPEERTLAFNTLEGVRKGNLGGENLEIYRMSSINHIEGVVDMARKNILDQLLARMALVKAVVGNVTQTGKQVLKTSSMHGVGAGVHDFWDGILNLSRYVKAKGRSANAWARIMDNAQGITQTEAVAKGHLAEGSKQLSAGALRPRTSYGSAAERAFNVTVTKRFLAMDMLDRATAAFNAPQINRETIFKLAHKLDDEGNLITSRQIRRREVEYNKMLRGGKATKEELAEFRHKKMGEVSVKEAHKRMGVIARRLRTGILNPNEEKELVAAYRKLFIEESDRISYRSNIAGSEELEGTWSQAVARSYMSRAVRKSTDSYVSLMAKHAVETNATLFYNTIASIGAEGERVLRGTGTLFKSGFRTRGKRLSSFQRENVSEAKMVHLIGALTTATMYYMQHNQGFYRLNPGEPTDDPAKKRKFRGTVPRSKHVQALGHEVSTDALGHIGPVIDMYSEVLAMIDTAERSGDTAFMKQATRFIVEAGKYITPHDIIANMGELVTPLSEAPTAAGAFGRVGEKVAKNVLKSFMPWHQDIKNIRPNQAEFEEIRTTGLKPGEVADWRSALDNLYKLISDSFYSAYGKRGHFKINSLGVRIPVTSQKTANALEAMLSIGVSGAKSPDPKYKDLVAFLSTYRMFGTGKAESPGDEGPTRPGQQAGIAIPTLTVPPNILTLKVPQVSNVGMSHIEGIPTGTLRETETTATISIPPHKQSYLNGLLSGDVGFWEDLRERMEKAGADGDTIDRVAEQRLKYSELFRRYGAEEGDHLIDVIDRLGTGKWDNVQRKGDLNDYKVKARELLTQYGDVYGGGSTEKQIQNISRLFAIEALYVEAWKITREAAKYDPDFTSKSPALSQLREQEERRRGGSSDIP